MMRNLERLARAAAAVMTLAALALLTAPALAQEGSEKSTAANTTSGIGILILMLGIAAILIIGGFYVGQNRAAREGQPDNEE